MLPVLELSVKSTLPFHITFSSCSLALPAFLCQRKSFQSLACFGMKKAIFAHATFNRIKFKITKIVMKTCCSLLSTNRCIRFPVFTTAENRYLPSFFSFSLPAVRTGQLKRTWVFSASGIQKGQEWCLKGQWAKNMPKDIMYSSLWMACKKEILARKQRPICYFRVEVFGKFCKPHSPAGSGDSLPCRHQLDSPGKEGGGDQRTEFVTEFNHS